MPDTKTNNQILIVEDSMVNRNILVKMLKEEYTILQAADGQQALDIIKEHYSEIAAIVLDLHMPVMDGMELLSILSQDMNYSNLPVLIATGEHNDKMESECLEHGAWDFVMKPYNPVVLRSRLHNIIGRSRTHLMQKIKVLAERDSLTGLYNRRFFMNSTQVMLEKNPKDAFVLIRFDIDNFRLYNASFGSKAGDELLIKIATGIVKRLSKTSSGARTYGRIESDVFCICVPYQKETIEEEILRVEKEIQGFCSTYRLKVSFGLYIITDRAMEMEKMYACAAEAARKCKNNLSLIYAYYDEKMSQQEEKAQKLTNEMEKAIREKQFQVYLQPKYSIDTNRPCGAEALVRWMHPSWGMVSPGSFIPVFEQNGLIVQLDYYMWESVCELLKKWMRAKIEIYPVSVNISRISMYNPQIVQQIIELTDKYEVPRHLLNLEITESAYMTNPDLMKEIIEQLRTEGFVILMDDFGSGYSSLNTLKDIDVDILKIDMKFLPTGHNNAKSEKILASIIRMAGWLGVPVIMEGVETKEQKDFLESIGCNYVQGYYYARPMPVADYEALLVKKEPMQEKQKDTDTLISEFDALWSSDSKAGTLVQSISIPVAILEYANGRIDIMRMNQAFSKEFATMDLQRYLLHEEGYKLLTATQEAVLNKANSTCESLFVMADGTCRWYQIHFNYIGTAGITSLVSASFMDVTSQQLLENELNAIFKMIKKDEKERGCLLIIDDQELGREILRSLFEDRFDILTAQDGQEGLEVLKENTDKVTAILLDMLMPRMDGQEFLAYKNQMEEAADIPVVVISAENSEKMQIHMLENGVNDYVTKPFVPAVVKRRLNNVLDYNSRFRKLVREYNEAAPDSKLPGQVKNLTGYSVAQIYAMIQFLSQIFDLVRIVDPRETAVITVQEDGTVDRIPYSCFSIWGKSVRCENCSSQCAMNGRCSKNKFELMKENVFYVVSQPVDMILDQNKKESVVLEIASQISDTTVNDKREVDQIYQLLQNTHNMVYTDPLTEAYNRRYLDEMLFLHHGQNAVTQKLALVMMDLNKFKQINDLFGHQTGDAVLKQVAEVLKKQIREKDSLIRYGGDEFVIILAACEQDQVQHAIERFHRAVQTITYGPNQTIHAQGDFGFAYTEDFQKQEQFLADMVARADAMMYECKKNR